MLPRPPVPAAGWRWPVLLGSPLRLQFALGSVCGLLVASHWALAWLGGRAAAAAGLHPLWMPLAVFPPMVAGFLATVRPRWLDVPVPAAGPWRRWALLHLAGLLLGLLAGGSAPARSLALAALTTASLAWTRDHLLACRSAGHRTGPPADHRHAWGMALGLAMLSAAWAGATLASLLDAPAVLHAAARWGWWAGVMVCVVVALHRMSALLQGLLPWLLAALVWRGAWGVADALGLATSGGATVVGVAMAAAALALLGAALDPRRHPRHHNRVTAWLQVALLWWAAGLGLDAAALLLATPTLGLAALHLLALGFVSGVWLTLASRALAGVHGRHVAIEGRERQLLRALQAVLLWRLLAAWPGATPGWMAGAATAWALWWALWCAHTLPALGQPPR